MLEAYNDSQKAHHLFYLKIPVPHLDPILINPPCIIQFFASWTILFDDELEKQEATKESDELHGSQRDARDS